MLANIEPSQKTQIDNCQPICYSKPNAGEKVATSQIGRDPGRNLIPAANDFHGSQKSESKPLQSDLGPTIEPHRVHWLWKETATRLRRLDARVREGKFVDEASEFYRWVQFSGLLHLFTVFDAPDPLKVSASEIQTLINDLKWDCELFWKNNPRGPWVSLSELEAINQKLDRIAATVATLSPPQSETATAGEPSLQVIAGGAS